MFAPKKRFWVYETQEIFHVFASNNTFCVFAPMNILQWGSIADSIATVDLEDVFWCEHMQHFLGASSSLSAASWAQLRERSMGGAPILRIRPGIGTNSWESSNQYKYAKHNKHRILTVWLYIIQYEMTKQNESTKWIFPKQSLLYGVLAGNKGHALKVTISLLRNRKQMILAGVL